MKNYFQFACELEPIDRFPGCMSKDDLLENLLRQDTQAQKQNLGITSRQFKRSSRLKRKAGRHVPMSRKFSPDMSDGAVFHKPSTRKTRNGQKNIGSSKNC